MGGCAYKLIMKPIYDLELKATILLAAISASPLSISEEDAVAIFLKGWADAVRPFSLTPESR